MSAHKHIGRPLFMWAVIGVALDTVGLVAFWLLLNAIGPLAPFAEAFLNLLALVTLPWLVHVVLLPTVFCKETTNSSERIELAAFTILFPLAAGVLILGLGVLVLLLITFIAFAVAGALRVLLSLPPSDQVLDYVVWTGTATVLGAGVGLLLNVFSKAPIASHAPSTVPQASTRSDALGGAIAAFLAFSGMFVALHFGFFIRHVPNDEFRATAPQLPTVIIIGLVALLPHLLMRGFDLLRPQ